MKKFLIAILIFLLVIFLIPRKKVYSVSGFLMDTIWEVKVFGNTDSKLILDDVKKRMYELTKIVDFSDPSSEISILNEKKILKSPSEEFKAILKKCKEYYKYTNGFFDPSIYPILNAYGFYDLHYRIPKDLELKDIIKRNIGFTVEISTNAINIPESEKLDFGAMLKGFIVDRIAEYIRKRGINNFIVNFGGEMVVSGNKNGIPWIIGIRNPMGNGLLGSFDFQGCIATSGDYERFFIKNGKKYTHIISPFTGKVDTDMHSASIIASNCSDADAIATALCVMGHDKAVAFIKKMNIKALIVSGEGNVERFNNFPKIH